MHGETPIKLSQLLRARTKLLRRAHLANSAYAYQLLSTFGRRIARAGLVGLVNLKTPDATAERYWATLTALEFNQSVIEEHFAEQDVMDLADAILFVTGGESLDLTFRIEEFADNILAPLRSALEQAGVVLDPEFISAPQPSPTDFSTDV